MCRVVEPKYHPHYKTTIDYGLLRVRCLWSDCIEYSEGTANDLLQGETETLILEYAAQSHGAVQSCVVNPGLIDARGAEKREIPGLPHIDLPDIAAALLEQVVSGLKKDTLSNDDLVPKDWVAGLGWGIGCLMWETGGNERFSTEERVR